MYICIFICMQVVSCFHKHLYTRRGAVDASRELLHTPAHGGRDLGQQAVGLEAERHVQGLLALGGASL